MYIAIPPSNTQHSVSHLLLQKQPGQQAFPIELLRESYSGSKKTVEGGGGGEKRFLLSPPPPPSFIFFALVPAFQTNLARKRLLRRVLQKPLISYFVAFTNNREIKHIMVLASVEGISFGFFRKCVSLRKHPFVRQEKAY